MNREELLDFLRIYRHDLMNDLQLIQGYASMGKYDVSNGKLKHFIQKLKEERQLQSLNIPQYVYWLLKVKLYERDIQCSFTVDYSEEPIRPFDETMKNDGETLLHYLKEYRHEKMDTIPLHVEIKYDDGWNIIYKTSIEFKEIISILNRIDHFHHSDIQNDELKLVFMYK